VAAAPTPPPAAAPTPPPAAAPTPPPAAAPTPPPAAAPAHTGTTVAAGKRKKREGASASEDPFKDAPAAKAPSAEPAAGECFITIGSRPWAEVWIDGKNTNKHTPFADYKIACGKHKIAFKRPDLQIDQTESITVSPGEKFKQSYSLMNDSE
jgi:hypothetical protein